MSIRLQSLSRTAMKLTLAAAMFSGSSFAMGEDSTTQSSRYSSRSVHATQRGPEVVASKESIDLHHTNPMVYEAPVAQPSEISEEEKEQFLSTSLGYGDEYSTAVSAPPQTSYAPRQGYAPAHRSSCTKSKRTPIDTDLHMGGAFRIVPDYGDEGFGLQEIDGYAKKMVFIGDFPVIVKVGGGISLLDSPAPLMLPQEVYELSLGGTVPFPVSDDFMVLVGAGVSLPGDFQQFESDQIQLTGQVIGTYQWTEHWSLMGGVFYFGEDAPFPILPFGGATYTPYDGLRYDLFLPRPRVAKRFYQCGKCSWWGYVGGGFGGGSWYIERPDGESRFLEYEEYQFLFGLERRIGDLVTADIEFGYLMGRELNIDDENLSYELDNALSVRFSTNF
ncbi:Hypothetical protein PBC10988_15180 [Planctomycetales bacterium 10988]|nr:Hypothetical protein PBC10988_15180 [Planctomycetales bacterium 10988]